jgi:hypothetical protein
MFNSQFSMLNFQGREEKEPQNIEQGISNVEGLGWRSLMIAAFS